jgi:hypothetical protein
VQNERTAIFVHSEHIITERTVIESKQQNTLIQYDPASFYQTQRTCVVTLVFVADCNSHRSLLHLLFHSREKKGALRSHCSPGCGATRRHLMRKRVQGAREKGEHHDELLHFTLSPLLPANHILVLNPAMHTATLLDSDRGGEVHIAQQQHFSPNGMGVLVPLLQAYPHYCPYEVLLTNLCPLSLEECREQLREASEMALRPVRRAVSSILPALRSFGLQVRSLRGAGYLIEAL